MFADLPLDTQNSRSFSRATRYCNHERKEICISSATFKQTRDWHWNFQRDQVCPTQATDFRLGDWNSRCFLTQVLCSAGRHRVRRFCGHARSFSHPGGSPEGLDSVIVDEKFDELCCGQDDPQASSFRLPLARRLL